MQAVACDPSVSLDTEMEGQTKMVSNLVLQRLDPWMANLVYHLINLRVCGGYIYNTIVYIYIYVCIIYIYIYNTIIFIYVYIYIYNTIRYINIYV